MKTKLHWLLLATLLGAFSAGCGGSEPDPDDDATQDANGKSDSIGATGGIVTDDLDELAAKGLRSDPDIIRDARIEGDELVLDVQYGGGCEEHEFALHWDGLILESLPAQVNLTLLHDSNNDFCEALKFDELRFDISALAGDLLIVNLSGTSHRLEYESDGGSGPSGNGLFSADPADLEADGYRSDGAIINAAAIDGTVLTLDVSFGGGCEEHEFALAWDGLILESLPAQVNLELFHKDNNDFCEAFLHETLTFDLAELGPGELIVNFVDSDVSVTMDASAPATDAQSLFTADTNELALQGYFTAGSIIDSAAIEGGNLVLNVSYGGGCEEHEFELAWDGLVLESLPAQVSLQLYHNSNNDFCEAFLSETLVFDLSELGAGPLIINLADADVERLMLE